MSKLESALARSRAGSALLSGSLRKHPHRIRSIRFEPRFDHSIAGRSACRRAVQAQPG